MVLRDAIIYQKPQSLIVDRNWYSTEYVIICPERISLIIGDNFASTSKICPELAQQFYRNLTTECQRENKRPNLLWTK